MLSNKPKVIVFDIGGVLKRWDESFESTAKILSTTAQKLHSSLLPYIEKLELGEMTEKQLWDQIATEYKYSGNIQDLAKAWLKGQTLIPSTWELVRALKSNGYRVVVCTNTWLGVIDNNMQDIPDFSLFEAIIDSSQTKARKPDPIILGLVEKLTGVKGRDIFLIDDSAHNCDGAQTSGWQVFNFDPNENNGLASCKKISELLLK